MREILKLQHDEEGKAASTGAARSIRWKKTAPGGGIDLVNMMRGGNAINAERSAKAASQEVNSSLSALILVTNECFLGCEASYKSVYKIQRPAGIRLGKCWHFK